VAGSPAKWPGAQTFSSATLCERFARRVSASAAPTPSPSPAPRWRAAPTPRAGAGHTPHPSRDREGADARPAEALDEFVRLARRYPAAGVPRIGEAAYAMIDLAIEVGDTSDGAAVLKAFLERARPQ